MPPKIKETKEQLDGCHIVRKNTSRGIVEYHYAFRGGPRFWKSSSAVAEGSAEYVAAFHSAIKNDRSELKVHSQFGHTVSQAIAEFRNSMEYSKLSDRTKKDYDKYLDSLEKAFGAAYMKMFEEPSSTPLLRKWKLQFKTSAKSHDYATTVVTRLLNWCQHQGGLVTHHFHHRQPRFYKVDRSELVWLPEEIDAMLEVAVERARRIIITVRETGLAPQDLGRLERKHIQPTPLGRRIFFKRTKTKKAISLPVTPSMAQVIDTTPADQQFILVSLEGLPLTSTRASAIVREAKKAARAKDEGSVREELRMYDMRGTAATNLLRAGCSLNEIAVHMGWGLRHASNIIQRYATLVPEVTDEVLTKLAAFWKAHREREED